VGLAARLAARLIIGGIVGAVGVIDFTMAL